MVNYHSELVSTLNKILPTYYEKVLTSKTVTPCISYMELNNYVSDSGTTLEYSRIKYQIKVWGVDLAQLQAYALEIDKELRKLGFLRLSGGELFDNNSPMIQKILTYEALALETY